MRSELSFHLLRVRLGKQRMDGDRVYSHQLNSQTLVYSHLPAYTHQRLLLHTLLYSPIPLINISINRNFKQKPRSHLFIWRNGFVASVELELELLIEMENFTNASAEDMIHHLHCWSQCRVPHWMQIPEKEYLQAPVSTRKNWNT